MLARKRDEYQRASLQAASRQLHDEGVATRRTDALKNGKARSVPERVALASLESVWRARMGLLCPGVVLAEWGPREKKHMGQLLKSYGPDVTRQMVEYVTGNWDEVNRRILKGKTTQPTVALLAGMHETFAAEAQRAAKTGTAEDRFARWYADHPGESMPAEVAAALERGDAA